MSVASSRADQPVADMIADECLAVRVRLLNRAITSIYDEALRPLGITVGQLNVLVAVAKLGPISPRDLARRLSMEKSTLSRNAERMQSHGWIEAQPGDSQRGLLLRARPKGLRLLERAGPLWKEAQARTESMLGQRGAQSLQRVANTVLARLGRE